MFEENDKSLKHFCHVRPHTTDITDKTAYCPLCNEYYCELCYYYAREDKSK